MKRGLVLFLLLAPFLFSYSNTWTITSSNNTFSPDSLTITIGDTVIFQLDTSNNAREVSFATWSANDSLPVTGFQTPKGGDTVTGLGLGTHYYVSSPNAAAGMKGQIVVLPAATISFTTLYDSVPESAGTILVVAEVNNPGPNPATFTVTTNKDISTAKDTADYSYQTRTFTNGVGTTLDTVYIVIADKLLIEPTETVVLHFTNVSSNAIITADSTYALYILNDDTLTVSFLGAAFSYQEGNDTAYIGVTISSPVPGSTSVTVVLDSGNAVKGVNFLCQDTTTLIFPANTSDTLYIPVYILEDTIPSINLQANFTLIDPTNGARLGISAYTIFIIDNDNTNGIDNLTTSDIQLYPNPAQSYLNVQFETAFESVSVYNSLGQKTTTGLLSTGSNTIDISSLTPGLYFIVAQNEDRILTRPFIKGK